MFALKESIPRWVTRALGVMAVCMSAGCSGAEPGDFTDVDSLDQGLASNATTQYWDVTDGVVDICYLDSGYASQKQRIRTVIEDTWEANSGLIFTWPSSSTETCPTNAGKVADNFMPIKLVNSTDFGGQCQFGHGGRISAADCQNAGGAECQCWFRFGSLETGAVHEIGHGLGLEHEHKRSDRPTDIDAACYADPNPDPNKWTANYNYTLDTTLLRVTPFDINSAMGYCRDQDAFYGTQPGTFAAITNEAELRSAMDQPLTAMDKLGIEMLYPREYTRRPVVNGGATNAAGTTTYVRSDRAYTLMVDWVARGGRTAALSNHKWKNASGQFSTSSKPSRTFTQSETVQVSLNDVLGRPHGWASVNVVPNNARHTAILRSHIALL